jgi:hypothetical protein
LFFLAGKKNKGDAEPFSAIGRWGYTVCNPESLRCTLRAIDASFGINYFHLARRPELHY